VITAHSLAGAVVGIWTASAVKEAVKYETPRRCATFSKIFSVPTAAALRKSVVLYFWFKFKATQLALLIPELL
jgi:hypothetical protein